jgi:uncharacterized tellurite resistance protein B-like protein
MKIKCADGKVLEVRGYRAAKAQENAGAKEFHGSSRRLPARVDLRPHLTPVEAQGTTQSCTANAVAGAYEYLMKRHRGAEAYDVSRLFVYYNARAAKGTEGADDGSSLNEVIESLAQNGACSERAWPFDTDLLTRKPPGDAYEEGRRFRIAGAESVPTSLDAWKHALADGNPILFGLELFASFNKQAAKGLVPMPTPKESLLPGEGHAMLCVGYSDADGVFIVRNSWGSEWGDGGYCYVPYRYMMEYNCRDSWVITHVHVLDPDESTWADDDASVLDGLNTFLARMPEESYARMLDAMGEHVVEVRLALLFLRSAGADGQLHRAELEAVAAHLQPVLEASRTGREDAASVLGHAREYLTDDALVDETIRLFAEYFSADALAVMCSAMQRVAAADGALDAAERAFVSAVADVWRVQAA